MKIWTGYGTEHSANLVIIGKFKTIQEANKAKDLINELTRIVNDDENAGRTLDGLANGMFSQSVLDFCSKNSIGLAYNDINGLLYDYNIEQDNNKIIITSNDTDFQSILKIMIHGEAKIEMYSAHYYSSPYGRKTYFE